MVTVNINGGNYSATEIDSAHFGGNAVAPYQDIGDLWRKLDDIVLESGITSLRYPGGQAAESYFDITNPNATSYLHEEFGVRPMLAQDAFLEFCGDNNISVTMMIPIKGATFPNGELATDWIEQVRTYIQLTLADADNNSVTIDAFEIGNEYRANMTHGEYGQIVDEIAVLLQEEFDAFVPEGSWSEPMIAVQVRAPNSHLQDEVDETAHNNTIISELSSDAFTAIDALIGHYYFSTGDVDEIPAQLAHGWSLFEAWEDAADKDMDWIITEWNVHHDYDANHGLAQINPLLEIFTEFLKAGVDAAQIWSTQYNKNSIAQSNGDLRASGEFFKLMLDKSIGMSAVDMDATGTSVSAHGFADDSTALLFISSLETSSILLDLGLGFDDGALIGSTIFGTTGNYTDEDADVTLTYDGYVINQDVSLGAFETLMIEIALDRQGSNANDTFTGSAFAENMVGAGGHDTLIGNDGDDQLFGGNGDDYLLGGDGADQVFGGANNDKLFGGNGDDELHGGTYWDSLYGGNGKDTMYGDNGKDYLVAGAGNDLIYGGAWDDTIYAGSGDDSVWGDGGKDEVHLGGGDDFFFDSPQGGASGADVIYGDGGHDIILASGGNDTLDGGSGIDTLTGGVGFDVFVFTESGTKWNEVITDFTVGDDTIVVALDGVNSIDDIMIFAHETTGIWTVHFRPNKDVGFIHNGSIQLEGSFTYGELYDAENFDFG